MCYPLVDLESRFYAVWSKAASKWPSNTKSLTVVVALRINMGRRQRERRSILKSIRD